MTRPVPTGLVAPSVFDHDQCSHFVVRNLSMFASFLLLFLGIRPVPSVRYGEGSPYKIIQHQIACTSTLSL
jgi:hypothetical protein